MKYIRKFVHSIQFYIIVMVVLAGLLPTFFLTNSLMHSFEDRSVTSDTTGITSQAMILANKIYQEGYLSAEENEDVDTQIELLATFYSGRVMIVDGDFHVVYDSYDLDTGKTVLSSLVFDCFENCSNQSIYDAENEYIGVVVPIQASPGETVEGAVLVSVSTSDLSADISYMWRTCMMMIGVMMVLVIFIAWFGSRMIVKPFNQMSDSIDQMQLDYENNQLSVVDYAETEKLSNAFNQLLGRMKVVDDSRKDFVANVSHELKTPLASMKLLADSLLMQDDVPVATYREFMEDISHEIDRENQTINDLLNLVRLEQSTDSLHIEPVNINQMVDATIRRLDPMIRERNLRIVFENMKRVIAEVDDLKMTTAVTNLIENAIKYNREGGYIHVTLNSDAEFFYLDVEDSGIGIPEESLDHIFDRFYRVDKSHSRQVGGTGLGLSIVRTTVLLHRGAIRVDSVEGKGTTFSVRIPLVYRRTEE